LIEKKKEDSIRIFKGSTIKLLTINKKVHLNNKYFLL